MSNLVQTKVAADLRAAIADQENVPAEQKNDVLKKSMKESVAHSLQREQAKFEGLRYKAEFLLTLKRVSSSSIKNPCISHAH